MNILYMLHSLDMGGAQKITVETAIGMKHKGHNVYVGAPRGELESDLQREGISYFEIDIDPAKKTIITFAFLFFRILCVTLKYKIDIIHTIHRWANFISFFVCVLLNRKLVWTDHNILIGKKLLTVYKDRIISVSNAGKRHLIGYFHIPEEKIAVIYNAVNPLVMAGHNEISCFLNEIGLKSGEKIVCSIANLTEQKGHQYLLKAIPAVLSKVPNAHFVLVGDGDLKQSLMDLADELKISKHIHLLGKRRDISIILSASDAVVLSSLWEGFPLVILESFSLGKPVIVTDVGGIKELVTDGETGFIVKPKDCDALADAMIKILSDDEKRKEMGIRGREFVSRNFRYDRMIAGMEEVYKGISDKRNFEK